MLSTIITETPNVKQVRARIALLLSKGRVMRDEKGQDDKIIAVHVDDPAYADYHDIADLPQHRLRELQRFFLDYKVLEGEEVVVEAPLGASEALPILQQAITLYVKLPATLRVGSVLGR
jgi:inorganic pyrophosphatase